MQLCKVQWYEGDIRPACIDGDLVRVVNARNLSACQTKRTEPGHRSLVADGAEHGAGIFLAHQPSNRWLTDPARYQHPNERRAGTTRRTPGPVGWRGG